MEYKISYLFLPSPVATKRVIQKNDSLLILDTKIIAQFAVSMVLASNFRENYKTASRAHQRYLPTFTACSFPFPSFKIIKFPTTA